VKFLCMCINLYTNYILRLYAPCNNKNNPYVVHPVQMTAKKQINEIIKHTFPYTFFNQSFVFSYKHVIGYIYIYIYIIFIFILFFDGLLVKSKHEALVKKLVLCATFTFIIFFSVTDSSAI